MVCYGFSFLTSGAGVNEGITLNYGYTSVLRTADYAWNIKNDPGFPVEEFGRARGKNVCAINSLKPNPYGSEKFKILSLKKYVNSNLKDVMGMELKMPFGKNEFGFIPMEILKPDENENKSLIALDLKGKTVEIELEDTISSIYFLHGCYIPQKEREKFLSRSSNFIFGIPIAIYTITYEDNTQEKIEARFGLNILDICPPNPRSRYMSEIRYFWEGRIDKGEVAFLYQYEWVNPNPYKKIKNITLQTTSTEAIPLIFAITTCGIK